MRLFSDYHTHPQGHRVQPYTLELLQPWVDRARRIGLTDIAFTDHDRYCEGVDFDVIEQLRAANPDLKIRAGIELDNDPQTSAAGRAWVEKHWDKLDFVLGSVHYLNRADQMFDTIPDGATQFTGHDIDDIYSDYFRRVREITVTGLVDCLAHIDLVKIHGHRSNSRVEDLIDGTLEVIASHDRAIELSTAGWRKPVDESYPADGIVRLAVEKGIHFTTASDAHSSAQLGDRYAELGDRLVSWGVREVCVFEKHERVIRTVQP